MHNNLKNNEFRDSLRLRYGLRPNHLPSQCDGCSQNFSVEHALSCSKGGGLVLLRHNDLAEEWRHLCAQALTPSATSTEPAINTGRAAATGGAGASEDVPTADRGDVGVHGFWRRGTTCIFDTCVSDTDAPSYRDQVPAKVLATHERKKKAKYLQPCLERRRHFTPLVFSVDGLAGKEAQAATQRLAALLSTKWKRTYSEVCGYVRSRLAIALVRSASMCLRGARDPTARCSRASWVDGLMVRVSASTRCRGGCPLVFILGTQQRTSFKSPFKEQESLFLPSPFFCFLPLIPGSDWLKQLWMTFSYA